MKTIKLLLALIFISTIFSSCMYAQDARLNLGKGWLRYDSDTAMFKISNMIGREKDGPLFKYKSSDFSWSNVDGLSLRRQPDDTSYSLKRLTIYRDTIVNDLIKSRVYIIYKPSYKHSSDLFDLKARYISTDNGSVIEDKTFSLLNNSYVLLNNQDANLNLLEINPELEIDFPQSGQYLVNIDYEYEFIEADSRDKEFMEAIVVDQGNELAHNEHSYYRPPGCISGSISTGSMSFTYKVSNSQMITLLFTGDSKNANKIIIKKIRVIGTLIN